MTITQIPDDAVHLWPDGTWCWHYELPEYSHMSDDFTVLMPDTERYEDFFGE